MVEQDYILRLLKQFFDSVYEWVHKPLEDKEQLPIFKNRMSNTFFRQPFDFFENLNVDQIINHFVAEYKEDEQLSRIEMIAELFYMEIEKNKNNHNYVEKTKRLLTYINQNSNTFSLERFNKINYLHKLHCEI